MADHSDPNAVNSIFSDIDISAADLYDLFGFPGDATTAGEQVVVALTFASISVAFSRAGRILLALGRLGEAERYLGMAVDMNPRHESFHVHR